MINKYEFHIRTNHNITDLVEKMKAMTIDVKMELGHKGIELYIHNRATSTHIEAFIKLYECVDGVYEYELSTYKKDDFMKLLEAFEKI